MKILISESQYYSLIESEVTESKHDNKDIKKLISWAEKKLGCTSHSIKNGIKLCPPEEITGFRCRTTHLTSKGIKPLQAEIADWFGVSRRDVDTAFRLNQRIEGIDEKTTIREYFIAGLNEKTNDVFLDLRDDELRDYIISKGGINNYFDVLHDNLNSLVIRGPYDEIVNIGNNFTRFKDLVAMALVDLYVNFEDSGLFCNLPKFFYLDLTNTEHTFVPECGKKMGIDLYNLKI